MSNISLHVLSLPEFRIEFDLSVDESIRLTRVFQRPEFDNFVFAAAEIQLSIGGNRYLISSESHTGNLIELLKTVHGALERPPAVIGLERIIRCGGLAAWMRGYWARLHDESSKSDDEELYDLLFPLCIVAEDGGYVAIYQYDELTVIEASAQTLCDADGKTTNAFSTVDRRKMIAEIARLSNEISATIRGRMVAN